MTLGLATGSDRLTGAASAPATCTKRRGALVGTEMSNANTTGKLVSHSGGVGVVEDMQVGVRRHAAATQQHNGPVHTTNRHR